MKKSIELLELQYLNIRIDSSLPKPAHPTMIYMNFGLAEE